MITFPRVFPSHHPLLRLGDLVLSVLRLFVCAVLLPGLSRHSLCSSTASTAPSTSSPAPAPPAPAAAAPAPVGPKGYTKAEVATHNNDKSCWVIIANKVYDVTQFLDDHPVSFWVPCSSCPCPALTEQVLVWIPVDLCCISYGEICFCNNFISSLSCLFVDDRDGSITLHCLYPCRAARRRS